MNYVNKIKSLGFKRIAPIIVCSYTYLDIYYSGYYMIDPLKALLSDKRPAYFLSKEDYSRILSFKLVITKEVSLYICLINGVRYFAFLHYPMKEPTRIGQKPYKYSDNSIKLLSHTVKKIDDKFWGDITALLSSNLLRQINLNRIC